MKALQLDDRGSLKIGEIPIPEPQQDERLLKVTHCALCRTDAKMWQQGHRDLVLPRVLGHEICGFSEKAKKRFVVWPGKACGDCPPCRKGTENLCKDMHITGFHNHGGLAEYIKIDESSLISIPDELPGELAVFSEPLACGINAIEQAQVQEGHKVLVYGAGTVGLMMAVALREMGAFPYINDNDASKLRRSEDFRNSVGIESILEPDNKGFDVVINAAPSPDTFTEGLTHLSDSGCFCLFSGLPDDNSIPVSLINEIHYRQLRIVGAYGCTRAQMGNAVEQIINHKNEIKLLIEDSIKLEKVPFAFQKIMTGQVFKYIVTF